MAFTGAIYPIIVRAVPSVERLIAISDFELKLVTIKFVGTGRVLISVPLAEI